MGSSFQNKNTSKPFPHQRGLLLRSEVVLRPSKKGARGRGAGKRKGISLRMNARTENKLETSSSSCLFILWRVQEWVGLPPRTTSVRLGPRNNTQPDSGRPGLWPAGWGAALPRGPPERWGLGRGGRGDRGHPHPPPGLQAVEPADRLHVPRLAAEGAGRAASPAHSTSSRTPPWEGESSIRRVSEGIQLEKLCKCTVDNNYGRQKIW